MINFNLPIKALAKNPIYFLAFGLGSGFARYAPGTFGTLMAVPLYFLIEPLSPFLYLSTVMTAFFIGIWICQKTSDFLGVHDHGGIVWDEFVGLWLTYYLVPDGWQWLIIGFLLFRFFDIVKPWPIKWLDQKVKGGFGIMIDDLIAGLMAWAVLQGLALFINFGSIS